jgi:hypothetical protein
MGQQGYCFLLLAGVALRAIYTTVFFMNDILVKHIKLLPLPEDTEKNNRRWLALITLELFLH